MNRLLIVLSTVLALTACKKEGTSEEATATEKPGAASKVAATPGSHEDWCEEHKVPESQCTQCDPKLAAAFKATGDWCVEHSLPESQCLKCNPALKIERPPQGK
jgi:hypothetical protein